MGVGTWEAIRRIKALGFWVTITTGAARGKDAGWSCQLTFEEAPGMNIYSMGVGKTMRMAVEQAIGSVGYKVEFSSDVREIWIGMRAKGLGVGDND